MHDSTPRFVHFSAESKYFDEVVTMFSTVWQRPLEAARAMLSEHAARNGFIGVAALLDRAVAGFAYGFDYEPDRDPWWQQISAQLGADAGSLDGSWVFAEIAVLPNLQGRGLGARLHDALLERNPRRHAILSTSQCNARARSLYEAKGWRYVSFRTVSLQGDPAYLIMMRHSHDMSKYLGEAENEASDAGVHIINASRNSTV